MFIVHIPDDGMSWGGFQADFDTSASSLSSIGVQRQSARMATASQPGNWEGLRKQARSLENEIDLKLVAFSKLGTNYSSSSKGAKGGDKAPLLGGGDSKLEDVQGELNDLLAKLSQVNEDMSGFAVGAGSGQSAAIHHTLQRHTEILQDYRQEFNKTASNIAAIVEREDLLSSVQSDISDYRNKQSGAMDSLQREMEHTRNSERLIDEQISIALETRESLVSQREILKAVQTKLNDLTNKFPMINNLVNKINFRKRRDTIILGVVIGLCLVFMLWYIFG